MADSIIG